MAGSRAQSEGGDGTARRGLSQASQASADEPRRSQRIRERNSEDRGVMPTRSASSIARGQAATTADLLEAARLLQERTQTRAGSTSQMGRTVPEQQSTVAADQQTRPKQSSRTNSLDHHHHHHHHHIFDGPQNSPIPEHFQRSHSVSPVSVDGVSQGRQVVSQTQQLLDGQVLSPTRRRKLQNLVDADARRQPSVAPEPVVGVKRARDNGDGGITMTLPDHHHHHHDHHRQRRRRQRDHHHDHRPHHHDHDDSDDDDDNEHDQATRNLDAKRIKDNDGNAIVVTQKLKYDPTVTLLDNLEGSPIALTLGQISSAFKLIQDRLLGSTDLATNTDQGFTGRYFSFILSGAQCAAWPLQELELKYLPLYMTTQYIADGSQYGWRNFFTQPQFRQHLVGAVIGEWITHRIFKHTAFGLPVHIVHELEELDREYLNYDGFVRTKRRADFFRSRFDDPSTVTSIQASSRVAAESFVEELLTVLHPLLPPPIFDPLNIVPATVAGRDRNTHQRQNLRDNIKHDLLDIVVDCVALHHAIRFTGSNGTIIRMVPHLQKGNQFYPSAPVDCVNQHWCNETVPTDEHESSELCVKMTCWPRVEGIVPHGPDMNELEHQEAELRQTARVQVRRNTASARNNDATQQQQHDHNQPGDDADDDDDNDADDFTWDGHDEFWPIVPDELQDDEGRDAQQNRTVAEDGHINTIKRAAYVTMYQRICDAKVYCEWTPQPAPRSQTLRHAVAEARREGQPMKLRVEDLRLDMWNAWAMYGGLAQWGIIAAGIIISVGRALNVPTHLEALMIETVQSVKTVYLRGKPLTGPTAARVTEQMAALMRKLPKSLQPFGIAVGEFAKSVFVEPIQGFQGLAGDMWSDFAESTLSPLAGSVTENTAAIPSISARPGGAPSVTHI